jgi:hypothetical protein
VTVAAAAFVFFTSADVTLPLVARRIVSRSSSRGRGRGRGSDRGNSCRKGDSGEKNRRCILFLHLIVVKRKWRGDGGRRRCSGIFAESTQREHT